METQDPFEKSVRKGNAHSPVHPLVSDEVAFGYPRDFLENQFVYLVISPRARGLSLGVNLNPVARCNLNCLYCEVDRDQPARAPLLDIGIMVEELSRTLKLARAGGLRALKRYSNLPDDLLEVRHVALSGDGEPTLADNFVEATDAIVHLRALGQVPPFKIVLLTNSTALDQPRVKRALQGLTRFDEVWAKLDAGTQRYFDRLNRGNISIEKITENILEIARERPVVIQSLFPSIKGAEPPLSEIDRYANRLKKLKERGANIPLVQIYSATRPMARSGCGHLPLRSLCRIAETVRKVAGLPAEVF